MNYKFQTDEFSLAWSCVSATSHLNDCRVSPFPQIDQDFAKGNSSEVFVVQTNKGSVNAYKIFKSSYRLKLKRAVKVRTWKTNPEKLKA